MDMAEVGMIILFSNEAPEVLREYCVIHDHNEKMQPIEKDDVIIIGNNHYNICCVGDTAVDSYNTLGHLTLKFSHLDDHPLSGTIYLKEPLKKIPEVGETIYFNNKK